MKRTGRSDPCGSPGSPTGMRRAMRRLVTRSRKKGLRKCLGSLLTVAGLWVAGSSMALAQAAAEGEPASGGEGKSLASAYLLVVLIIGLGLLIVLRPTHRLVDTGDKLKAAD